MLAVTDPLGQTTRYTYDANGHVKVITDALDGQTLFDYFPDGLLQTVTDTNQHATSYAYDVMGRTASRTYALQRKETFTYDLNGNPYQLTDRKGQVTTSTYDALDRLRQITYADTSTITYTYDAGDRVTQIADSLSGTIVRGYDDFDRLLSETTGQGAVSYTYDSADHRTKMTVQGQPDDVIYDYDNANRLTRITRGTLGVTIGYDNADRRTTLTLPNGVVAEYGYDDASQVGGLTYRTATLTLGTLTYGYDLAGRRTEVGGSLGRTGLPPPVASATYDAANQLTAWGSQIRSYDPNGNLWSDGLTTYSWDARGQLTSMFGGTNATFQYDGLRRRTARTNGDTTGFLYDGTNAVQELSGTTPVANLLTGARTDELLARTDSSGSTIPVADTLGSILALTDLTGTLRTQYTYTPFGATSASGIQSSNANQYTGRENDGTCFYYYQARYYEPAAGRFLSEDPLGFMSGIDFYVYAADNPVNLTDPLGMQVPAPAPTPNPGPLWFPWWPWSSSGKDSEPEPGPYPPPYDRHSKEARKKCEKAMKDCQPCIPPVGTVAYRYDASGRPHGGVPTPHWRFYVVNQSPPERGCSCFWDDIPPKQGGLTDSGPPSGTKPMGGTPSGGGRRILLAGF